MGHFMPNGQHFAPGDSAHTDSYDSSPDRFFTPPVTSSASVPIVGVAAFAALLYLIERRARA